MTPGWIRNDWDWGKIVCISIFCAPKEAEAPGTATLVRCTHACQRANASQREGVKVDYELCSPVKGIERVAPSLVVR